MATPAMSRVVEREVLVFRSMWKSVTIWNLVTPLMYLGAMGLGLGGLVDSKSGGVGGLTYLEFVTPGLMAASAAMAASGESLWPVMLGTKWQRHFHATVASPITAGDVYGGLVLWIGVRAAASMAAFLAVAALLGGVPSLWGCWPSRPPCSARWRSPPRWRRSRR